MKPLINYFLLPFLISLSTYTQASFVDLKDFGENPGELSAQTFIPKPTYTAVVVLLHGCIQNGVELAKQSGLFDLAQSKNFALLVPQQSTKNNAKACFNWFSPQDTNIDQGEILSIKNMVLSLKSKKPDANFYIVGLSAGAAMSAAMLVNYPNLFTAGAIVSGIPFPCAKDLIQAISCMKHGPSENAQQLASKVRALNHSQSVWPSLSIWTGRNDIVVHPKNAILLAQQWANLTHINSSPVTVSHNGYTQTSWQEKGVNSIELFEIDNMGHGLAVKPNEPGGGDVGPYLLSAPLSTSVSIIKQWGI